MKTFTPTQFRANSSIVFNEVQQDGKVTIESKNRPDMVVMLSSEFEAMREKIRQFAELAKSKHGDAHLQADLLK